MKSKTKNNYRYYELGTSQNVYKVDTENKIIYTYFKKNNSWLKLVLLTGYDEALKNLEANFKQLTMDEVFLKLL